MNRRGRRKRRRNRWAPTTGKKQPLKKRIDFSNMTAAEIERLGKASAMRIIQGTDNLSSRGHTGSIQTRFGKLHYRSTLERGVLKALDGLKDLVASLKTEPFYIEYRFRGLRHYYVPDLIVKLRTGQVWLLEVKPKNQLNEAKNQAKFEAALGWCIKRGNHLRFGVLTTKDQDKIEQTLLKHDGCSIQETINEHGFGKSDQSSQPSQ